MVVFNVFFRFLNQAAYGSSHQSNTTASGNAVTYLNPELQEKRKNKIEASLRRRARPLAKAGGVLSHDAELVLSLVPQPRDLPLVAVDEGRVGGDPLKVHSSGTKD